MRVACDSAGSSADGTCARISTKEILCAVAARLGNTPAVCKRAYVHPAVLEFGAVLAANVSAASVVWAELVERIQSVRSLQAAEARLLAFLDLERSRTSREVPFKSGAAKQKAQPEEAGLFGAVRA